LSREWTTLKADETAVRRTWQKEAAFDFAAGHGNVAASRGGVAYSPKKIDFGPGWLHDKLPTYSLISCKCTGKVQRCEPL
jgi:hypothetical protein